MTTEILKDYIIYKIYCKNKEIAGEYYGHTCAFRARKHHHKNCCNNENNKEYNTDKYKFIRLNGGWNNWEMVHIEELNNCSLVNAKIREQYHIDLNKSNMNKFKAYITEEQRIEYHKEYRLENRDKILDKSKEYHLKNRDKILDKSKEYYENNKDKAKEYHLKNRDKILDKSKEYYENNKEIILEKAKEYRLENRDKILEQKKEYRLENRDKISEKKKEWYLENRDKILDKAKEFYENNKEIILEQKKEKMTCDCGKTFTKKCKVRHERSKFHCQFIETLSH